MQADLSGPVQAVKCNGAGPQLNAYHDGSPAGPAAARLALAGACIAKTYAAGIALGRWLWWVERQHHLLFGEVLAVKNGTLEAPSLSEQ